MEGDRARWPCRSSKPVCRRKGIGGFDSLLLPPIFKRAQQGVERLSNADRQGGKRRWTRLEEGKLGSERIAREGVERRPTPSTSARTQEREPNKKRSPLRPLAYFFSYFLFLFQLCFHLRRAVLPDRYLFRYRAEAFVLQRDFVHARGQFDG